MLQIIEDRIEKNIQQSIEVTRNFNFIEKNAL